MKFYKKSCLQFPFLVYHFFTYSDFLLVNANLQCYQCTSQFLNSARKENVNCPKDGPINTKATYLGPCSGKCIIKSSNKEELVTRTCSDLSPLPQPLPDKGCYSHDDHIYCFCNTSFCNQQDMNDQLENRTVGDLKTLTQFISEKNKKDEKNNEESHKDDPHQCYICQSSYNGKKNENCPGDAHINAGPTIYRSNCSGICYVRTDIRFKGIVFRGCSDLLYGFPDPAPKDGCYNYYLDVWCICRGRLCNTKPLGKVRSKDELDHLVIDKTTNNGSSLLTHLTTMALILSATATAALAAARPSWHR